MKRRLLLILAAVVRPGEKHYGSLSTPSFPR